MNSLPSLKIPKVPFREPERNLPGRRPRGMTSEARFTLQFARAYVTQHAAVHSQTGKSEVASARQIAVNGYGIADLVTVSWREQLALDASVSVDEFVDSLAPTVRAFEVKLSNWRRGMKQAHRYRSFANAAILVLPPEKGSLAVEYIETFRRIHVGLWSFDPKRNRITTHYTPRPSSAVVPRHYAQAIALVSKASRSLPVL